jgi:hypothetical protein
VRSAHLLVPSAPFDPSKPDEAHADEVDAFRARGWTVSLFSFEDFEQGRFRARPPLADASAVLYRGWMLADPDYERLALNVSASGSALLTSPDAYRRCHHLPGWYAACSDLTIATVIAAEDEDFDALVASLGWQSYFVKDFVKSLTTARGSLARDAAEIREIVRLLRQYRGRIEGGICIREFTDFRAHTEQRYFVVGGTAYGRDGSVPGVVSEIARRVESPFFSVDVAETAEGQLRVIELGDGQVSDRKEWPVDRFVEMLCTSAFVAARGSSARSMVS